MISSIKNTIEKVKSHPKEREYLQVIYLIKVYLIFRIEKELLQLNNQNTNDLIKN